MNVNVLFVGAKRDFGSVKREGFSAGREKG